jgi:hypothetical protein
MSEPQRRIVHPLHTDGTNIKRPRLGCQLGILVLPFFVWIIWSHLGIGAGTSWGHIPRDVFLVFGLAILSWGVMYLIVQHTTRIQVLDGLLLASIHSARWPLELMPQDIWRFQRKLLARAEKLRLQLFVGILSAITSIGCLYVFGMGIILFIFSPFKLRHPDDPLQYALIAALKNEFSSRRHVPLSAGRSV